MIAPTIPSAADLLETDLSYLTGKVGSDLDRLAGARILITGGAGFLGYYLVQALARWNQSHRHAPVEITVLDNFVRGEPGWIGALARAGEVELTRYDIRDPLPPDLGEYHYIVHAAGIASPTYYRRHPIETMDANINGLRSLLEYARRRMQGPDPVRGFLFFSSSEIYGDPAPEWIPTPEDYRGYVSCTGPRACYDESKRYGETLCVNFARVHGVPATMARPFNNYGPGLKATDGRVIPDFASDLLAGRDLVLRSDGRPTRTFCYVADAVAGYLKILLRGRPGEPYNIGIESPEVSITDLASRMVELGRQLFGYSGRVIHQPSPEPQYLEDNPLRRCPSIAKAREELGYDPEIDLNEGLRRSLAWYSHNPGGSAA